MDTHTTKTLGVHRAPFKSGLFYEDVRFMLLNSMGKTKAQKCEMALATLGADSRDRIEPSAPLQNDPFYEEFTSRINKSNLPNPSS